MIGEVSGVRHSCCGEQKRAQWDTTNGDKWFQKYNNLKNLYLNVLIRFFFLCLFLKEKEARGHRDAAGCSSPAVGCACSRSTGLHRALLSHQGGRGACCASLTIRSSTRVWCANKRHISLHHIACWDGGGEVGWQEHATSCASSALTQPSLGSISMAIIVVTCCAQSHCTRAKMMPRLCVQGAIPIESL
jgi:hypothetical protein